MSRGLGWFGVIALAGGWAFAVFVGHAAGFAIHLLAVGAVGLAVWLVAQKKSVTPFQLWQDKRNARPAPAKRRR